jgi:hypothetical protein
MLVWTNRSGKRQEAALAQKLDLAQKGYAKEEMLAKES